MNDMTAGFNEAIRQLTDRVAFLEKVAGQATEGMVEMEGFICSHGTVHSGAGRTRELAQYLKEKQ